MKYISRPQHYRIRRIIELIRQGMEDGRLSNCSLFVKELEITRRTVMSDLEFLRCEENAPIEYLPAKHGYVLTDSTWEMPSVNLSGREVFSFTIARKLLNSFKGTPLEADMNSALRKISESLEDKFSFNLEGMTERFTVISEDYVVQNPKIWAAVAEAVDKSRCISIEYQKFNGEIGKYTLEPYHLLYYHGNWYVLAKNCEKGMTATFALSRVMEVRTGDSFGVPEKFNVSEYIENSFGIVRGGRPFKVRLLCSANIAAYIKERVWSEGQRIREKRNGCIELTFETAGWKELVRWILSWQPDMKVISPKRLKLRVEEKMRMALD